MNIKVYIPPHSYLHVSAVLEREPVKAQRHENQSDKLQQGMTTFN